MSKTLHRRRLKFRCPFFDILPGPVWFCLTSSRGGGHWLISVRYFNSYLSDCQNIWYRYSCSPDEFQSFLHNICDFSSIAPLIIPLLSTLYSIRLYVYKYSLLAFAVDIHSSRVFIPSYGAIIQV